MKRNDFLKKTAASVIVLNSLSVLDLFASDFPRPSPALASSDLAKINNNLRTGFEELVEWLKTNKWEEFLLKNTGLTVINWDDDSKLCSPQGDITRTAGNGLDDFAGNKLIEPGNPSLSLLYHMLASPRVKPETVTAYPNTEQLDSLENYIYALKKWEDYLAKADKTNVHIMVLAYEYRPAYKTPTFDPNSALNNKKYAQLVYSRTGIARIGNHCYNYDTENRSFINRPVNKSLEKQIAVTPARYGLFLVELVTVKEEAEDTVKLMNYQSSEKTNLGDRHFIRPVCKLFDNPAFTIRFGEYHVNEKLQKFAEFKTEGKKFELPSFADTRSNPFRRVSCTFDNGIRGNCHSKDSDLVVLKKEGNSVLLYSKPGDLVRKAIQDEKFLYFTVPLKFTSGLAKVSNRRYNSFKVTEKKTKDANDAVWTDFIFRRDRRTSRFRAPKNAPLFMNIKYQVEEGGKADGVHIQNNALQTTIDKGDYCAQIFEDGICDGCVSAKLSYPEVSGKNELTIQEYLKQAGEIFPSFHWSPRQIFSLIWTAMIFDPTIL